MFVRCPVRLRPRDFNALTFFAETNPALAELAEDLAWENSTGGRFAWGFFFEALRTLA